MRPGPALLVGLAVLVAAAPPAPPEPNVRLPGVEPPDERGTRWSGARLRFALGSEYDTNARRAVQGANVAFPNANRPFDVVGDGLVRVVLDSMGRLRLADEHALQGHYVLGAKRFVTETTEDLLVQEIGLLSQHGLTGRFGLTLDGTYKGSRIQSGLRDYDVLTAGLGGQARLGGKWRLDIGGRITRFTFAAEPRFDYWGPRVSLGLAYRPTRRWALSTRGGVTLRRYDGRALVEGLFVDDDGRPVAGATPIRTFCEDPEALRMESYVCEPGGRRRDTEITTSAGLSYRGPFLVSAQYLLRLQRSSSDFENIDRHRLEVSATFSLPWQITVNVLGALQINRGVSITDQKFLADADESQNSLNVGVQRPVLDRVYVEARYALFSNQFTQADVTFVRHTGYVGLGYRANLIDLSR